MQTQSVRYSVRCDNAGCECCGHGMSWTVVTPDGFDIGTSYGDRDDALEMCDSLQNAFDFGFSRGTEACTSKPFSSLLAWWRSRRTAGSQAKP